MHAKSVRRAIAIVTAFTALIAFNITTAFAAVPLIDVNTSYDLQVDSDWGVGAKGSTIVPVGETILLSGLWYNSKGGDQGEWIRNSKIQYTWRSGNRDLVGNIQGVSSWYDPEPSWDPSECVTACFAQADIGERMGSTDVSCRAIVDPEYTWTGKTEASATVYVVGLAVEKDTEEIQLGESVTLSAYWASSIQDTPEEAQKFFRENSEDPAFWTAADCVWKAASLETPYGTQVEGEEALAAAAGAITPVTGSDDFFCKATVTPTQPGTYEFTCAPTLGTGATSMVVEVLPTDQDPQFGNRTPGTDRVLVPAAAEYDELWQEFAVETEPGYADGEPKFGTVYWSVLDGDENTFYSEDDELLSGETLELPLSEDYFIDGAEADLVAWLVPEGVQADPDAVEEYGEAHPECVAKWTLVPVDAPTLETIADSELTLDEATNTITGLTAAAAGMNPEGAVIAQFYWNAGSEMSITRENGTALGEDESVGTGSILKMQFPDTNVEGIEATFIVAGDVTGTGTVTITDLVQMARALNEPDTLTGIQLQAADFTGTGAVSVTDLVREAALLRAADAPGD